MQSIVSFNLDPKIADRVRAFMSDKRANKKQGERIQDIYDQIITLGIIAYNKGDRIKL